ncbi:MAG TPA: SagB/ThcOx family dehydrogenase, partial [Woeseiaceae bacterium]
TPAKHSIRLQLAGDRRRELSGAALEQSAVRDGAAVLVIAAVYARTSVKYRYRAERYVHIEAGHAAQNVYLQATSLDLGTVVVGAFEDDRVGEVLRLPPNLTPLALLPVGVRP